MPHTINRMTCARVAALFMLLNSDFRKKLFNTNIFDSLRLVKTVFEKLVGLMQLSLEQSHSCASLSGDHLLVPVCR